MSSRPWLHKPLRRISLFCHAAPSSSNQHGEVGQKSPCWQTRPPESPPQNRGKGLPSSFPLRVILYGYAFSKSFFSQTPTSASMYAACQTCLPWLQTIRLPKTMHKLLSGNRVSFIKADSAHKVSISPIYKNTD